MKPSPVVLKLVDDVRDQIIDAGAQYGVDPRAIAGSILAENTMNVQMTDDIKRGFASTGISHIGTKYFSIGLGQIHTDTAMDVEPMMAKMEHRPERSESEIAQELLNPDSAVKYAAAILRQAQDLYKENGIDISKKPEILTTLYNLGKVQQKADLLAQKGQDPKPNYFGIFVDANLAVIGDTIGWDPDKGRLKPRRETEATKDQTSFLKKEVSITSSPPSCSSDGPAELGAYNTIKTRREYPSRKLDSSSALYRVIGHSVDCELQDWSMIETGTGQVGWVKKEVLARASGVRELPTKFTCTPSSDTDACKQKALGATKQKEFLGSDDDKDFHFLPLARTANSASAMGAKSDAKKSPLDWRKFSDDNCFNGSPRGMFFGGLGMSGMPGMGMPSDKGPSDFKRLSKEERQAYSDKFELLKSKLTTTLGLDRWDSEKNPLSLSYGATSSGTLGYRYAGVNGTNVYPLGNSGTSGNYSQPPIYLNPPPGSVSPYAPNGYGSVNPTTTPSPTVGDGSEGTEGTGETGSQPIDKFMEPLGIATQIRDCNTCMFNSKALDAFLNSDLSKLKTLGGFSQFQQSISTLAYVPYKSAQEKFAQSNAARTKIKDVERDMEKLNRESHIDDSIADTCSPLFEKLPKAKAEFDQLLASIDKTKTRGMAIAMVQPGLIVLKATCQNLIDAEKAHNDPSLIEKIGDHPCVFQSGKTGTVATLLSLAAKFEIPDSDKENYLLSSIRGGKEVLKSLAMFGGGIDVDACAYDPIASSKLVNAVAALPCVEAVLAADPILVQAADANVQSKVFNLPFSEGDRFAVKFKQNCTGQMMSPFQK